MAVRCVCLIPSTGRATRAEAVASAVADGWDPIILQDTEHVGAAVMRERLLATLDPGVPTLVRHLDDDDALLPHRRQVIEAFEADPRLDLVYTDNLISSIRCPGTYLPNKLWGDPYRDRLRVNPWTWVARLDSLLRIKQRYRFLWDPADLELEGLTCWLRFLESGLVVRHLAVEAYRYNRGRFETCVTRTPIGAYGEAVIARCRAFRSAQPQGATM